MADYALLPASTYRASSPQGRRKPTPLNPIIEDDHEDLTGMSHIAIAFGDDSRRRNNTQDLTAMETKIEQWLSPMSDHFPTPRGTHFLAAPRLPATPYHAAPEYLDDTSSETSSSVPSVPSTQMWNRSRESIMTATTDFNDLYDVSDDEKSRTAQLRTAGISRKTGSKNSRNSRRLSRLSVDSRRSLTPLVIPEPRHTLPDILSAASLKKQTPIAATPHSAIDLEAAQLSFMRRQHALEVPALSAAPSLDGSLNSEELAAMSAPPTPLIGANEDGDDNRWSGVQLQPGALATLHALSGDGEYEEDHQQQEEQVIEFPRQEMSEMPRQLPPLITNLTPPPSAGLMSPTQQRSLAGLTKLEIPSPGGFFSELSTPSRTTWQVEADNMPPATSATAEQFYKTALWGRADSNIPPPPPLPRALPINSNTVVVERVVEVPEGIRSEDLPTAIRVQATPITARRIPASPKVVQTTAADQPSSPINVIEILRDRDLPLQQQQENALSHSERTQRWLMAQRAYLKGVPDMKDKDQIDAEIVISSASVPTVAEKKPEVPPKNDILETEPKKKTVRFSEAVISTTVPKQLPSKLSRIESAYWRAFADLTVRTQASDAFVHRLPRFEALQAQRISLREAHRNQLLGKHQLSVLPQSAKKRMSANVVRGDDQLIDDPEKIRADKEAEALDQMRMATWHVAATKLLSGGKLITSPVIKRLNRQSRMLTAANGLSRDRARILDLGSTAGPGDWAWHVSLAYPNTKVYTVTTRAIRQLSNCNVRGPPNHRQIAVEKLTRLPFSDNQFDLISARDLHSLLKIFGENGEDEWEACMAECLRVLKPGGYLEFSLLDADIINPGPLGLAKSVEFGFTLKTLGYDASPSKLFVNRLYRAGFEDLKRSWMCLPLGPKPGPPLPPASRDSKTQSPRVEGRVCQMEAMVTGSADNLAAVSGFVAGWSWEKWILRTEMEKIAGEKRLGLGDIVNPGVKMREAGEGVRNVHGIVEEGRARGGALRMLRGWARKPVHGN
ncbi:hypothetical protein DL546_002094 [Coniochaeta pulveracea]|uniref:Methyltransferase type 11 domain-containing protein n=1 Tax=Coniochaeta pulveracea TaxID=177199 RepID=A0A420XY63_9PEZI|nr:hypothetical protein DL546_002094 [Coniochaeta pulveracea]